MADQQVYKIYKHCVASVNACCPKIKETPLKYSTPNSIVKICATFHPILLQPPLGTFRSRYLSR